MKIFNSSKPLLACIITCLSLTIISCNDAQIINSESNISLNNPNRSNTIGRLVNPISHTEWSKLNNDEQVNEIKRIIEGYGGELQGLAYSDKETIGIADVYVLNADIPEAKRQQLTQVLSELIGTSLVLNIQSSRSTDDMGNLDTLESSTSITRFSIDNVEQVNEIKHIVERYGAKLQSLGYSGDLELSLKVSYYPKKLSISDFENLEKDLEKLTGLNIVVDRRSIIIKPL